MWLVLCSSEDASAIWAYQGLKRMGIAPLELVTAESLACSQWEHRLSGSGTLTRITLANGRVIDGDKVKGALNRLHGPSPYALQKAADSDREYAQAELTAFYLSWLHGLPGVVINRPTPMGLSGAWLHPSEWTLRAWRAGLRTRRFRQSAQDAGDRDGLQGPRCVGRDSGSRASGKQSVIALRHGVFGGLVSNSVARACGKLVANIGAELLGIELAAEGGQWVFAEATPSPDLRAGGTPLLRCLAQVLMEGASS
jgi:hypothetical protein